MSPPLYTVHLAGQCRGVYRDVLDAFDRARELGAGATVTMEPGGILLARRTAWTRPVGLEPREPREHAS